MPSARKQRFEFQQNGYFFVQPRSKKRTRQFDDNVEEMEQDIVADEGVWFKQSLLFIILFKFLPQENCDMKVRNIV